MSFRSILASIVCKGTYRALRLVGRGGTSLPGKLGLKIDPRFLRHLSSGVKTIVVTGTNGKTTSTHIIAQALKNTGEPAFYNRSGANLLQGVTTEFALRCSVFGKKRAKLAAIECDEGLLASVCEQLDPDVLVVTNIFRDQLDRFGEVMHTRDKILAGIKNSPHARLCLNADDSIVSSLADDVENEILWYGINCEVYPKRVFDLSDARRCIKCGTEYEYEQVSYGHLGKWKCPACGFARKNPDVAIEKIISGTLDACNVNMNICGKTQEAKLDVPAGYDLYNCCCVAAGLHAFGLNSEHIYKALAKFKHGFGRGEVIKLANKTLRLMLVKNPAGCNQVLNLFLNNAQEDFELVVLLNDQDCDGHDVSWIYDAGFEELDLQNKRIICGGDRAEDMALRLKYAGAPENNIIIEKDNSAILDKIDASSISTTVISNYSAMLAFRAAAAKRYGLAGFWEG